MNLDDLERLGYYIWTRDDGTELLVRYLGEGRAMIGGEPVEPNPHAGKGAVEDVPRKPRTWLIDPAELARPASRAEVHAAHYPDSVAARENPDG